MLRIVIFLHEAPVMIWEETVCFRPFESLRQVGLVCKIWGDGQRTFGNFCCCRFCLMVWKLLRTLKAFFSMLEAWELLVQHLQHLQFMVSEDKSHWLWWSPDFSFNTITSFMFALSKTFHDLLFIYLFPFICYNHFGDPLTLHVAAPSGQ